MELPWSNSCLGTKATQMQEQGEIEDSASVPAEADARKAESDSAKDASGVLEAWWP